MTSTTTGAGTYNPLYYWVVGVPLKLWPDYRGLVVARLMTGAAMSALFAAAVAVAVRLGRRRDVSLIRPRSGDTADGRPPAPPQQTGSGLRGRSRGPFVLLGVVAAITPVAVNLSGAVNPAGLEIAAAVALWAALISIVYERDDSWRVFAVLGVSGAVLATLRELGIGWLFGSLAVMAIGLTGERLRELLRLRAFWVCAGVVLLAAAGGALWILLSTQGGIGPIDNPSTKLPHGFQLWVKELTHRTPYYTSGLVGLLSYGDVAIPLPLIFVWFAAVGLLLVVAFRRCGRRIKLQLATVVAIPFAILVVADVEAVKQGYWISQGRYALPMLVGAPMLAGYALSRTRIWQPARQARILRIAAFALVPLQAVGLWVAMIRYQHGFTSAHPNMSFMFGDAKSVDPFTGTWLPVLGPYLPVALCLAGAGVLIAFLLAMADAGEEPTAGTAVVASQAPDSVAAVS